MCCRSNASGQGDSVHAADAAAMQHVLEFDAREAADLFWFLSGEGSCALGLDGIDRLYDLLCDREGDELRSWIFSEVERQELLEEMDLQDCEEMTDEPIFARLRGALVALGSQSWTSRADSDFLREAHQPSLRASMRRCS